MSAMGGEVPDAERLDVLVYAERLACVEDEAGLPVRDIRLVGTAIRVVLVNPDGNEIAVQTTVPVDPQKLYTPAPQQGSVRAFERF